LSLQKNNLDPTSFELDSKLQIFDHLQRRFPQAIHLVNSKGETALHCASWGIQAEIAKRLCELGLDPTARDRDGNSALDHLLRRKASGLLDTNYLLVKRALEREMGKVEDLLVQRCTLPCTY
jgi:ankyrin repeat protein